MSGYSIQDLLDALAAVDRLSTIVERQDQAIATILKRLDRIEVTLRAHSGDP